MYSNQHVLEDAIGVDIHVGDLGEVRRRRHVFGARSPLRSAALPHAARPRRRRGLGVCDQSRGGMLSGPSVSANRAAKARHGLANRDPDPCRHAATPIKGERGTRSRL